MYYNHEALMNISSISPIKLKSFAKATMFQASDYVTRILEQDPDVIDELNLTEEELRERQDEGRYWEIVQVNDDLYKLYIILDNETVLCVERARNGKHYECIFDIADAQINLPESLRGRYYNYDEH